MGRLVRDRRSAMTGAPSIRRRRPIHRLFARVASLETKVEAPLTTQRELDERLGSLKELFDRLSKSTDDALQAYVAATDARFHMINEFHLHQKDVEVTLVRRTELESAIAHLRETLVKIDLRLDKVAPRLDLIRLDERVRHAENKASIAEGRAIVIAGIAATVGSTFLTILIQNLMIR